jgi:large subunit ribosomal protein L31e
MIEEEKEEVKEKSRQAETPEKVKEPKGEEKAEETLEREEEALEEAEVEKPPAEEEVKPPPRKEEEAREEIVEEKFYTISLGKTWLMPPNKRAPKAIRMIREFVKRHMKLEPPRKGEVEEEEEPKKLIISNDVNEKVWRRGIEKPPRKIRIRAAKDKDGNVTVYLAEGD